MSLDYHGLGSLFELSRDAVVGVQNNKICFANPAAREQLCACVGQLAEEVFPSYILQEKADHFTASLPLKGCRRDLSISRWGDLLLISSHPPAEAKASAADGAARIFSEALGSLRLAVDGLVSASKAESSPLTARYCSVLYQNYYRLLRLCSHLSLWENLNKGSQPMNMQAVDLEDLCRQLCRSLEKLADAMETEVEFGCGPGLYITAGDPDLLEVLLLNLITNSLQNSSRGSKVRLSLKKQENRFVLCVDDNGKGMSTDKLSRLCGPEEDRPLRDYIDGAGLGLRLVRGIAELHGGAVLQQAREDGFSTRVLLPIRDPQSCELQQGLTRYSGMQRILTELSVILPDDLYKRNLMD